MTKANISIALYADCPHCEETLDLFDEDDCYETGTNDGGIVAWDMVKDWLANQQRIPEVECTCGKCDKVFFVNELEW